LLYGLGAGTSFVLSIALGFSSYSGDLVSVGTFFYPLSGHRNSVLFEGNPQSHRLRNSGDEVTEAGKNPSFHTSCLVWRGIIFNMGDHHSVQTERGTRRHFPADLHPDRLHLCRSSLGNSLEVILSSRCQHHTSRGFHGGQPAKILARESSIPASAQHSVHPNRVRAPEL
jgi:hypothetical protein